MKNRYIRMTAIILPIVLAICCLAQMVKNNNQATMPVPREYVFIGEYSYDGNNWYTYSQNSDISALDGDMVVKGHLDSDIPEGGILNFYCNHIGVSIYVNGEPLFIDTPSEMNSYGKDLMASMCGKRWEQLMCPEISTEDEIEIHFINHHNHGNENAYKEALSSFLITPPDNTILEIYLKSYIEPYEMAGYALLIIAVMMLGAALSAYVFKSDMMSVLFKIGIATLFVAGYIVLDVMLLYYADELLVVKTYGSQLCLMLAVYFVGLLVCDSLKDKNKKIAGFVLIGSGILNICIMVLATLGRVLLYDTLFVWELAQYIVSIVLIVFCILEMKKEKRCRIELIFYVVINSAILIDMASPEYGMYYPDICFKAVYVIMLIVFLFRGAKQVVLNQQASAKNKKLKAELEQSRIAVMLSQIQPHFLYNSLTSVMDLCDTNPKKAKSAIADFADYLRGNLDSLKTENLIFFRTELQHIERYLRLEKLRFQDELNIVYDIQTQDFMLPTLSIQPLVENAVKHGVGKKTGGGTVTIQTTETEDEYIIRVTDDGVGFVVDEIAMENSERVGIENIRKRLDMMLHAKLEIHSKIGEGTTGCIRIPKVKEEL